MVPFDPLRQDTRVMTVVDIVDDRERIANLIYELGDLKISKKSARCENKGTCA
jgi:PII-like signaling protein